MRAILLGAATLALLAPAPVQAQSLVIPDGFSLATVEGNTNLLTPGNPSIARIQLFYAQGVMGGKSRVINGFRMRPEGTSTTYRPYAAIALKNFEVWAGNHPGPAQMDRFSHAGNHTNDYVKVVAARTVNFPAAPLPTKAPDLFSIDVPLDKAFTYTNAAGLMVELIRDDQEAKYYRYYLDAYNDAAHVQTPAGTSAVVGTGCPTDFLVTCHKVNISGTTKTPEAPYPGASFFTQGEAKAAQIPLLGTLGVSDKNFGAMTLPIDLGAYGATGCTIYNDWVATQAGVSDNTSVGEFKLFWGKIPYDPIFIKVDLFHQAIGVDLGFNALGLRASHGLKITMGLGFHKDLLVGSIYGNYFGSFPNYTLADDEPQYQATRAIILELY